MGDQQGNDDDLKGRGTASIGPAPMSSICCLLGVAECAAWRSLGNGWAI